MSAATARPRAPRRWPFALLVALIFVGVRLPSVWRQGLWADEYFSLAMATGHGLEHPAAAADPARGDFVEAPSAAPARSYARLLEHDSPPAGLDRVLRAVHLSDTSPPLYYVALWAWTRAFGTSDAALRALSLLFAFATLPVLARLARRIGGAASVAPACLLFALLPTSIWYSTEGRMYSLMWLEAAGLAACSLSLREGGSGRRRAGLALAWIAIATAGLLTHYAFAFVLAAFVLALFWKPGRLRRTHLLAVACAAALLVLPWYRHLPADRAEWRVTDYWLKLRPGGFRRLKAIAELVWSPFSPSGPWGLARRLDRIDAALVLAIGALATWRLRTRWLTPKRALAWLWVGAACAGPIVLDALQGTYMTAVPRYALAGLPAAVLLLATAFGAIPPRLRCLLLALLLASGLYGGHRVFDEQRVGQPFRELGRELARSLEPGDLLVVHSIPSGVVGLSRELELAGAPEARVLSWVTQLGVRRAPEDLVAAAQGARRVVHVTIHDVGAPADAEEWLKQHANLVNTRRRLAARTTVFEPVTGATF